LRSAGKLEYWSDGVLEERRIGLVDERMNG